MQAPIIDKKSLLSTEEKERVFELLEKDDQLLKETFEVILQLVISDPKLTYQIADLIEADYRNLFLVILKKSPYVKPQSDSLDCCIKF